MIFFQLLLAFFAAVVAALCAFDMTASLEWTLLAYVAVGMLALASFLIAASVEGDSSTDI